LILIVAIVD